MHLGGYSFTATFEQQVPLILHDLHDSQNLIMNFQTLDCKIYA